jgi:hypothetical protein
MTAAADLLTHADGVGLAIELIRELEAEDAPHRCAIEARFRATGAPQDNVALRYLQALREAGQDAQEGFAAVLSDFIASALDGATLSASDYEKTCTGA